MRAFLYVRQSDRAPIDEFDEAPDTNHWTRHWTVGDALEHLGDNQPKIVGLLDRSARVIDIWHCLTLEMQDRLNEAFTLYDVNSGRV